MIITFRHHIQVKQHVFQHFSSISLVEVPIFGAEPGCPDQAVSTVSALLCVAAIGGLATMSTANAGCKFGALVGDGAGPGGLDRFG